MPRVLDGDAVRVAEVRAEVTPVGVRAPGASAAVTRRDASSRIFWVSCETLVFMVVLPFY